MARTAQERARQVKETGLRPENKVAEKISVQFSASLVKYSQQVFPCLPERMNECGRCPQPGTFTTKDEKG